jgi:hypothetical protein
MCDYLGQGQVSARKDDREWGVWYCTRIIILCCIIVVSLAVRSKRVNLICERNTVQYVCSSYVVCAQMSSRKRILYRIAYCNTVVKILILILIFINWQ